MSEAIYYGTAPANLAVGPLRITTSNSAPKTPGIDVSRYQGNISWNTVFDTDGKKFAAIRLTVGNYYNDPNFAVNWQNAQAAGVLVTPYLVVAPASYDGGPKISSIQHWDYFVKYFGDRKPNLPIVLDCELTRGQSKTYITSLIHDLVYKVFDNYGRYPLIYTRQTWWDINVLADDVWQKCPLWASRFNSYIDGPWSDGKYVFRDWDYWHFWQWTDEGELLGIPDYKCDLDHWNGTLEELLEFADGEPAPPPSKCPNESRIEDLEAEAIITKAELYNHAKQLDDIWKWIVAHDDVPPPDEKKTVTVAAVDKAVAFYVHDFNAKGKPIMVKYEPVIRHDPPDQFEVYPEVIDADGTLDFYRMYMTDSDGNALYVRKDKVMVV